ncbi:VOC family protein [soil metagenome]
MAIEVIGIDHIYIAVSDLARSQAFYDPLMSALGFRKNAFGINGDPHIQYYNKLFGYVLRPATANSASHDPYSPGLHHLCFRVEDKEAVVALAAELGRLGLECTDPALYPQYAPDYHALFLNDPDGIRLEVTNFRQERKDRAAHWHEH